MKVIEAENLFFAYEPEEGPVLKELSFEIEKGCCVIVEGDNGSGKTTLFRILNGLSFPQEGIYRFCGTEINEHYLKDNRRAKAFHKQIGYLFQNPDIMLFNSSVYDEIAFGPRQMGLSEDEVRRRTSDCMHLFGIEEMAGKAPYHLSGGQKKKTALAAVLALNPEVVILDEPCAGLDRSSRAMLKAYLKELKSAGKTLLIATHDTELSSELGDMNLDLNRQ